VAVLISVVAVFKFNVRAIMPADEISAVMLAALNDCEKAPLLTSAETLKDRSAIFASTGW
jgi:hypothetical protein